MRPDDVVRFVVTFYVSALITIAVAVVIKLREIKLRERRS